ncbi:uncharacterized protein LOC117341351 [Pecten maximus]|uniref:uncharacterized protein LOC117341351 n=1 Tax=Pecten maximus TaxID=6579 RepID=UPI0014587C2C|nr:uncharacterized protein LOC117341351 [Pecten maximus]
MDSREENHSIWDEAEEKGQETNGSYYNDDNLIAHGDVVMWDLDDVDIQHTGDASDHLTPKMSTVSPIYLPPKNTEKLPTSPTLSNLDKQLSPVGMTETVPTPKRPISSPKDTRFRDLFPNPELKLQMMNSLGKTNAGGAFVIDSNITMYGDVMMLDLDSEDEGHSPQICTAVEKFSQLTETPMDVIKPANTRTTTTGIRHLMAIRNPELSELPNGSGTITANKRKNEKRKSKHGKIKEEVASASEYQSPEEQLKCCPISTAPEVVDINTEKKPFDFVKMVGHLMSRLGAYIQKKLICH